MTPVSKNSGVESARQVRVLHLPVNWASQTSILVRALRQIGVQARGLVRDNRAIQAREAIEAYRRLPRRSQPLRALAEGLAWWRAFEAAVRWADVVHWQSGAQMLWHDLDLRYVAARNKARLVTFWGSDIRIPDIAAGDNPYFASLAADSGGRYAISYERSRETQARYARRGFECMIPGPELAAYIQRDLFPSHFSTEASLLLSDLDPVYPDPDRARPVVVHMPSNPAIKGTAAVLRAVEQLKAVRDFEFRLIQGVPRSQALALLRDCDVMLDQFVIGSFGTAALEAMALGKPTVCYIKPSLQPLLPQDHAFVIANSDRLAEVLDELLKDGKRRLDIGRQSRLYVEKYHDALKIAADLVRVYGSLIMSRRRGNHERR